MSNLLLNEIHIEDRAQVRHMRRVLLLRLQHGRVETKGRSRCDDGADDRDEHFEQFSEEGFEARGRAEGDDLAGAGVDADGPVLWEGDGFAYAPMGR